MTPLPDRRRSGGRSAARLVALRMRLPAALLAFAIVYGTAGYVLIEHFGVLDAVYMTVTTLVTVGYGEIHPLSPAGRAFTLTLIAIGVGAVFILFGAFTTALASGELGLILKRRSMRSRLDALDGHYIICAYGRVGRSAAEELTRQGQQVVVIETLEDLEPLMAEDGMTYIMGDPTEDAVLEQAGIHRAKALLCAVDSDAVNVYITLTARSLNPDLFILARASRQESVEKLRRAGSNRVVSPYTLSGVRMASLSMQPAMIEFVDMISVAPDLRIEELIIGTGSPFAGREVRDVCRPYEGVMLLALKRPDGELLVPPRADSMLGEGDVVIAVGQVKVLNQLAAAAV
ncbi:MAG: voltage-gated potassium channel [Actinomycetota bacterium]|nr:voltage-gated potassium channel [Actinomycetota bacterium]